MSRWPGMRPSWIHRWKIGMNADRSTDASRANTFTLICWAITGRLLRRRRRGHARRDALIARMRRLDEELRLLDLPVRLLAPGRLQRLLVGVQQHRGELGPRERVVEDLRVVVARAEL